MWKQRPKEGDPANKPVWLRLTDPCNQNTSNIPFFFFFIYNYVVPGISVSAYRYCIRFIKLQSFLSTRVSLLSNYLLPP